jgi:hypothetical protein
VEKITDKATSENSSWKELLIEVANSASFREIVFKEEDIK